MSQQLFQWRQKGQYELIFLLYHLYLFYPDLEIEPALLSAN